ncbi:MAG: hypothetical protein ACLT46_02755 [Hungatella sp.]
MKAAVKKKAVPQILSGVKRKSGFLQNVKRDKYLLLMFLPVAVYYLIFCYLPMTGLVMAFTSLCQDRDLPGYIPEVCGIAVVSAVF